MEVKELRLINFRNYKEVRLRLSKKTIILTGENGQGKTNLAEAIYFLANLKSFRGDDRESLIQNGKDFALIEAKVKTATGFKNLKAVISRENVATFLNGAPIKNRGEFKSESKAVCFFPRDAFLFKDAPRDRREKLDDEIAKFSPVHEFALKDYFKILKERNELLREKRYDPILMEVLTKKLAALNAEIAGRRYDFITEINREIGAVYSEIYGEKQSFMLKYVSFIQEEERDAETIYRRLTSNLAEDEEKRTTLLGIHRDDFKGFLNGADMSLYASQGQQRMGVIALNLTIIDRLERETTERPIVILDDVLSELDEKRQKSLLNRLQGDNQLLITVSSLGGRIERELMKNGEILNVKNGVITKRMG